MKKFLLIILFIAFSSSLVVASDNNRKVFVNACMQSIKEGKGLDTLASVYDLKGERLEIQIEYFRSVTQNIAFSERLCNDSFQLVGKNKEIMNKVLKEAEDTGMSLTGLTLLAQLQIQYLAKGVRYLSAEKRVPYFEYTAQLFTILPPTYCEKMMKGEAISPMESNSIQLLALQKLPLENVRKYLDFTKDAMFAEIFSEGKEAYKVSNEKIALIDSAVYEFLESRSIYLTSPQHTLQVLFGLKEGSDEEYCEAGRFYYKALAEMQGELGDLARIYVSNSIFPEL